MAVNKALVATWEAKVLILMADNDIERCHDWKSIMQFESALDLEVKA